MLGMRDTINPEGKTTGAYYYEGETLKDAYSTNVLGYECWQGDKCEWLEGVTLNKEKADGRWSIETPGRPARSAGYRRICGILASQYGLRSPYGLDRRPRRRFETSPLLRLAKRVQLYAPGGLSVEQLCVRVWRRVVREHDHDSSNTNASIGSRLAFRGKVVKATSVSEYKALPSVE